MEKVLDQILETQNQILKTLQQHGEQLKTLEQGQTRLENKANKLELRMENEIIEKLRGLYDDREIQNERLGRIESKLDSIEIDAGYLVARVSRLEKVAK
ncbi:MAG: hypothetical protein K6T65_06745 [Peptococcaceae bacterium]|nr:hypothetical protein [Peptococcaceae bacterium]